MINIRSIDKQVSDLENAARKAGAKYEREIAVVVNDVTKKIKKQISKQIRAELATSAKAVNEQIETSPKANAKRPRRTITLKVSNRITLANFSPNQKKKGVSYKISKTQGRKTIQGAFIVEMYGGNVYKRNTPSKAVGRRKRGPSPWGVFVKRKMTRQVRRDAKRQLLEQMRRRTKYLNLKAAGTI